MRSIVAFVLPVLLWASAASALAATPSKSMKEGDLRACIEISPITDPRAPKDKSQLAAYCQCVSDEYWKSIPQIEQDLVDAEIGSENLDGPLQKAYADKILPRQAAAQKKCAKK